jgi:hypothetical protein
LNECSIGVEEAILFPFQWGAKVRAAVPVEIYLGVFFYCEQMMVIHLQSLGSPFFDIVDV